MNFFKVEEYTDCFEIQTINGQLVLEISFTDNLENYFIIPEYLNYNQAKSVSRQICNLLNKNEIKIGD